MQEGDYLLEAAFEVMDDILIAYSKFEEKKPIVLFDVQEKRIYVCPYIDFKNELSPRSQEGLASQYSNALRDKKMVVFVRDNERKRLVSYSFDTPRRKPRRKPHRSA